MIASTEMPDPLPEVPCQCFSLGVDDETGCVCGPTERVLRARANLSPAQREWCLSEIASVEGYTREDHVNDTDAQLGHTVLCAWVDYCRDKGLM